LIHPLGAGGRSSGARLTGDAFSLVFSEVVMNRKQFIDHVLFAIKGDCIAASHLMSWGCRLLPDSDAKTKCNDTELLDWLEKSIRDEKSSGPAMQEVNFKVTHGQPLRVAIQEAMKKKE
jgi:hypothetical protein